MMERSQHLDGFHIVVGAAGVLVGLARLPGGAGTGWSLLIIGFSIVLLSFEYVLARQVEFEIAGFGHLLRAVIAIACVSSAALYLSRGADDLPHLLPGHDADSGDVLLGRGVALLVGGVLLLGHVVALARPTRAAD
jgi:hypothetical protein